MKHVFKVPHTPTAVALRGEDHRGRFLFHYAGMRAENLNVTFVARALRWYEYMMPWRWSSKARTVMESKLTFASDGST